MPSLGKLRLKTMFLRSLCPRVAALAPGPWSRAWFFFPKGRTRKRREPILPRGPLTDQALAVSVLEDRGWDVTESTQAAVCPLGSKPFPFSEMPLSPCFQSLRVQMSVSASPPPGSSPVFKALLCSLSTSGISPSSFIPFLPW